MRKNVLLLILALSGGALIIYSCKKEYSCENCGINSSTNKAPVAIAGRDTAVILPADSIELSGSASYDPDGTINEWRWIKISGPASFTMNAATTAKTVVKNLGAGRYQFELKVTDNGGLSAKDTIQVTVEDGPTNHPPIANAGSDTVITLPANTVNLDGSRSTDPDNNITNYVWTKISGPSSFNVSNANVVQTQVTNLEQGIYLFELKVTDAGGLFSKDTVKVIVNPTQPPHACAGADQAIILPISSVTLDGTCSTDPYNNITTYLWSKIAGPSSFSITDASAVQAQVTSLMEGVYLFELKVSDAGGLLDRDTVKVFVLSPPVSGDVYVAGSAGGAVYWKNGTLVSLTSGTNWSKANDIAISGTDIYVAGSEYNGTKLEAKYWKNGIPVTLAGGSVATAIAISGSDVYVAGYEDNATVLSTSTAKYWKNGISVVLTDGSQMASANGIAVSGSDVYVVGVEESNTADIKVARYWKNGTSVSLANGTNYAEANDITISGSDVYIAGSVGGDPVYWKNGNYINLSGGSSAFLAAYGIAVSGSDVYVAGINDTMGGYADFGTATYWKNGIPVVLTSIVFSNAAAIAVSGSDVYVAGYAGGAVYWKNGTPVSLSYNGTAHSIIVVQ